MTETWQSLREFGATPNGRLILIAGGAVAAALILVPLWRSFKYLVKALLWGLLVVLVLAAAGAALWWWMNGQIADPERRAGMRREAEGLVRQGISTNLGTWFPSAGGTNDAR